MKNEFEQKEIQYSRGKVAGHDVRDDQNNLIVARGETITDDIINKAIEKNQLHYLMLAAAASVVQAGGEEARQRLQEFRNVTEGHEVDFVRGKVVGRDAKDYQGNILVKSGDTVTDGVIECAQRQGLLQELVLAVGAPGLHIEEMEEEEEVETPAEKMGYTPYSH